MGHVKVVRAFPPKPITACYSWIVNPKWRHNPKQANSQIPPPVFLSRNWPKFGAQIQAPKFNRFLNFKSTKLALAPRRSQFDGKHAKRFHIEPRFLVPSRKTLHVKKHISMSLVQIVVSFMCNSLKKSFFCQRFWEILAELWQVSLREPMSYYAIGNQTDRLKFSRITILWKKQLQKTDWNLCMWCSDKPPQCRYRFLWWMN